ncbi:hypothetical protein ACLOJK_013875 [Asimina triloba]
MIDDTLSNCITVACAWLLCYPFVMIGAEILERHAVELHYSCVRIAARSSPQLLIDIEFEDVAMIKGPLLIHRDGEF